MSGVMITVPYEDFVEGIAAKEDLDAIRLMITCGNEYASTSIKSVLGLESVKHDGTN